MQRCHGHIGRDNAPPPSINEFSFTANICAVRSTATSFNAEPWSEVHLLCVCKYELYFNKTKKRRFQRRKNLSRQQQCWGQLTQVFEYGKITNVFTDPMCFSQKHSKDYTLLHPWLNMLCLTRLCFMQIWVKVFNLSVMDKRIVRLIYKKQASHRVKWQVFGMRIITVSASTQTHKLQ